MAPKTGPMVTPARYTQTKKVKGVLRSSSVSQMSATTAAMAFMRIPANMPAIVRVTIIVVQFIATACGMTKRTKPMYRVFQVKL